MLKSDRVGQLAPLRSRLRSGDGLTSGAVESQNSNFNPNWMVRGLFACELITPN